MPASAELSPPEINEVDITAAIKRGDLDVLNRYGITVLQKRADFSQDISDERPIGTTCEHYVNQQLTNLIPGDLLTMAFPNGKYNVEDLLILYNLGLITPLAEADLDPDRIIPFVVLYTSGEMETNYYYGDYPMIIHNHVGLTSAQSGMVKSKLGQSDVVEHPLKVIQAGYGPKVLFLDPLQALPFLKKIRSGGSELKEIIRAIHEADFPEALTYQEKHAAMSRNIISKMYRF